MIRAVLFDFYGTLGEYDRAAPRLPDVLASLGYTVEPEVIWHLLNDGLDGSEHHEHSVSRDHYVAWQQRRVHGVLESVGIDPEHWDEVLTRHIGTAGGNMRPYDEAHEVLAALRDRGVDLAICSNWDWDLTEAVTVTDLHGHLDVMVSSAWVGARKPHPIMYEATLERLESATGRTYAPDEVLFVGDTWTCDVEGPRRHGMRAAYVRRSHREPDGTAPADIDPHVDGATVHRFDDLRGLLGILD